MALAHECLLGTGGRWQVITGDVGTLRPIRYRHASESQYLDLGLEHREYIAAECPNFSRLKIAVIIWTKELVPGRN